MATNPKSLRERVGGSFIEDRLREGRKSLVLVPHPTPTPSSSPLQEEPPGIVQDNLNVGVSAENGQVFKVQAFIGPYVYAVITMHLASRLQLILYPEPRPVLIQSAAIFQCTHFAQIMLHLPFDSNPIPCPVKIWNCLQDEVQNWIFLPQNPLLAIQKPVSPPAPRSAINCQPYRPLAPAVAQLHALAPAPVQDTDGT